MTDIHVTQEALLCYPVDVMVIIPGMMTQTAMQAV